MDDGALFKSMLAAVSHAQQQRHALIQGGEAGHHLQVGNVFLPAIHKRTMPQSALSMKHLQVIEQCILAENRREAQLAQCSSEHERRYLIKRFRAQRDHERDLIQALTLGQPAHEELQIVDMDAALATYKSPLLGSPQTLTTPDKVIKKLGRRTFATNFPTRKHLTKPSLTRLHDECGHKSLPGGNDCVPSSKVSPKKPLSTKPLGEQNPKAQRLSSSASLTRKDPPSPSPKMAHHIPPKLPHALRNSPLKPPTRKPPPSDARVPHPSPSPTTKKKPKPKQSDVLENTKAGDNDEPVPTVTFEGATSFFEARQLAMATAVEQRGLVEGETQTTSRADATDLDRQQYVLMLTKDAAAAGPSGSPPKIRPHSSPEPRRRRLSAEPHHLPSLGHSPTDPKLAELFHATASTPGGVTGVRSFVSADRSQTIRVFPHDKTHEVVETHLAWEPQPEVEESHQDTAEGLIQDVACGGEDGDCEHEEALDSGKSDHAGENESDERQCEEEQVDSSETLGQHAYCHDMSNDESVNHEERIVDSVGGVEMAADEEKAAFEESDAEIDYQDDEELITLIYDMIDQVECDSEPHEEVYSPPIQTEETIEPGPGTRRPSLMNFGRFVVRIQSAFRGHRARRSFRFTLYQEALQCGVLGAMPGTLQGRSGWYQDPKSFMAYYFVVRPDGEWCQKIVLRCGGLILTLYQMHEQILSRVHVPADED